MSIDYEYKLFRYISWQCSVRDWTFLIANSEFELVFVLNFKIDFFCGFWGGRDRRDMIVVYEYDLV